MEEMLLIVKGKDVAAHGEYRKRFRARTSYASDFDEGINSAA